MICCQICAHLYVVNRSRSRTLHPFHCLEHAYFLAGPPIASPWTLLNPSLPVPVTRQNPVPEPAPAPEPVTPTPGHPVPTNTGAPDVELINGVRCFSYNALYNATTQFSADGVLGSGGYGRVHAGVLRTSLLGITGLESTTKEVAIKMLDPESLQCEDHFQAEVRSLTLLRHANIVPLYGICHGVYFLTRLHYRA